MRNVERGVTKNVQAAGEGARGPEAKLPNAFVVWFSYWYFLQAGHLCLLSIVSCTVEPTSRLRDQRFLCWHAVFARTTSLNLIVKLRRRFPEVIPSVCISLFS